jgi:ribonucleoside-diphosphate reductase beta chain
MILDAVEMEEEYNRDLLPGGILGLNATYINQYVKYLADRRLEELGFDPEYKVSNPAKWMATANDTYELVNFFESTNTSYEANAKAVSGKKPEKRAIVWSQLDGACHHSAPSRGRLRLLLRERSPHVKTR